MAKGTANTADVMSKGPAGSASQPDTVSPCVVSHYSLTPLVGAGCRIGALLCGMVGFRSDGLVKTGAELARLSESPLREDNWRVLFL